jgi:3'-phosphoadenosine 5'-phosphosulfate sulfotransferase (PAPS reductase)/FAD synthetase
MIPEKIRDFETYIIGYSGGKDSTAVLLWSLENLPREQLRMIYHPVPDVEPPENETYLRYIQNELGVKIETVKAGDRPLPPLRNGKRRQVWQYATSFFEMVRLRGMWPSFTCRYCTTYFKQWPCALYAKELPRPVLLTGQRKSESKRRSKLPKFSGQRDWKQTQDGLPIFRPILNWSENDVWREIYCNDLEPNPVYRRSSRCNCLVCFQARKNEVLTACQLYPNVVAPALAVEREIKHLWKYRQGIVGLWTQAQRQIELPGFERVVYRGGLSDPGRVCARRWRECATCQQRAVSR